MEGVHSIATTFAAAEPIVNGMDASHPVLIIGLNSTVTLGSKMLRAASRHFATRH